MEDGGILGTAADGLEIGKHGPKHRLCGTEGLILAHRRDSGMEGRHPFRDPFRQITLQRPGAEQTRLVETAHLDRVFQRLTRTPQLRGRRGSRYGHHLQVQMRRQTGIEAEFLLAKEMSTLEGGEIQEAQIDRFLDFVSKIPREKDMGDMGLDVLHPRHRVRVGTGEP